LIDESRKAERSPHEHDNSINEEVINSKPKVNFIIDQLINHEEKFSDDEIREHLLTFLITASETTANLVSAAIMYMAIHQDIQQRAFDEIIDGFDDAELSYERLSAFKYLEMVLKETLRLFSPLPIAAREAFEDCDVGIGRTLKKGTEIYLLNYILHQRKDIYGEDARRFNPENFSPENIAKRDSHSFLPFGFGLKNCIGNRYSMIAAKVFIAKLLKSFKFETSLQEEDMKMKLAFIGKLAVDYSVTISRRKY